MKSFFSRLPLHPLLIAAYAVLFVYAANISDVLPSDLLWPLTIALAAAALILLVCGLVFRDLRRGALVATAIVVAFAFFGHVGALLDTDAISEPVQLALWVVAIVAVAVYAIRARGSLESVTAMLNVFAIALIAISLVTIFPAETGRAARASADAPATGESMAEATRLPDRDIYLIIFDRYGSDASIMERFGIQNDLYPKLEAAGFQVVPGARASYRASDFSIAAMLSMQTLSDLTESVGRASDDRTPARERLGDHEVGRFLRANGYRYLHLGSWYGPTQDNPIADENRRWGQTTEFEQVLRDSTALPALERLAGTAPEDTDFRNLHRNEALFQLRQLERIADDPARTFTFAHVLLPHPPYGFDADGEIILKPVEEAAIAEGREGDLYEEQLAFTNDRIVELIDSLLDKPPDEQPIVVLSGDEGPFICYNTDCIDGSPEAYGIRFGTLRAYYLPELDYEVPADDTGVNIFRMILREYFGADLPDLPNRSWSWPDNDHLYDFQDVTDQLPLPGG